MKKTYGSSRPLQAMCLQAPSVANRPLHHAGDPIRNFIPGNLAVLPPGRVLATPVLKAGVHPILNQLHQPLAKGQGHHGACQPLGRQVGDLAEKKVHLDHLLLGARLVWAGKQGAGFDTTNHSLCHPLLLSRSSRAGYDRP